MSGGTHTTPGSAIRKTVIVAFLVGGMMILHRFGIRTGELDPTGMLAFGFVVLASYTVGQLVDVLKLPRLIGYIIAGFLLGPSLPSLLPERWRIPPFDAGILNHSVQAQLSLIDALAVALIALTAGGELKVESLRRGFRQVMGLMTGHALAVLVSVFLFGLAVSGAFPKIQIDALSELAPDGKAAMALFLATFAVCTSPAVTLAVIGETGAKGPFTRLVMSSVVLLDVPVAIMFSIAGTVAATILGVSTNDGSLGSYLLVHVGGSLTAGLALGTLMGLYLRYVGAEVVLFLVAVAYVGTFLGRALHLSPLLMFVAAGFGCANFSRAGDRLIEEIEALSLPVYVVFFTSTGAHIDVSSFLGVAPYAAALAVVRAASTFVGVRVGARVSGASEAVQSYGFMGFISQAGVALSLAALIGKSYGAPGASLQNLMIGCIVINELFGAVLFKTALSLAKELPGDVGAREPRERPTTIRGFHEFRSWPPVAPSPEPWGPPLSTQTAALEVEVLSLEQGLKEVSERLREATIARFVGGADAYWKALRREVLRGHRRIWVAAQGLHLEGSLEPLNQSARATLGDLAVVWRTAVLDHAGTLGRAGEHAPGAAFEAAIERIDDMVDAIPARLTVPYEGVSYARQPGDSLLRATRRSLLRLHRSVRGALGQPAPTRSLALAGLARYHLSGRVPPQLEPMAATLLTGERQLARRSADMFDRLLLAYHFDGLPLGDRAALMKRLAEVRREIEERLNVARTEIDRIAMAAEQQMLDAPGGALRAMKSEVLVMSTFDLRERARRYSLVFRERSRALDRLVGGLAARERDAAADFGLLALELELVRLESQVARAVDEHGGAFARRVAKCTHEELGRLGEHMDAALVRLEAALAEKQAAPELAAAIRQTAEPLARGAADGGRAAAELETDLSSEGVISPILEPLLLATGTLSERYAVPIARREGASQELSEPPVPTAEIAFRDAVVTYIETTMARDLLERARVLARQVTPVAAALLEVERIVTFNAELAGAELDVFGEADEIPEATRSMVREMLIGPLRRAKARVDQLRDASAEWPSEVHRGIRAAVLDRLSELRGLVISGAASELKLRVIRDLAKGRAFFHGAMDVRNVARVMKEGIGRAVVGAVGEARLPAVKAALGLPEAPVALDDLALELRPSTNVERLPIVYRRLFTEHALQAGDLLTGRSSEIARARRVLANVDGPRPRTLAIIGNPGIGKSALVHAVVRSLGHDRVRTIALKAPTTADEVDGWFAPGTSSADVTVLEGFEWLFSMAPGGFAPLDRLLAGIVAKQRRCAWIVTASSEVWRFAARLTALEAAFPEILSLEPASLDDLMNAVLSRHGMSGYQLRIEAIDTLLSFVQRTVRRLDRDAHVREDWFRTLHALTGGMIRDGLRLWLESVRRVDEDNGIVHLGPIPRPPIAKVARLPDSALLLLAHATRQGWTTPDLWAGVARLDEVTASAEIGRLEHWGLLARIQPESRRYRIAPHLETTVRRVLKEKRWIA